MPRKQKQAQKQAQKVVQNVRVIVGQVKAKKARKRAPRGREAPTHAPSVVNLATPFMPNVILQHPNMPFDMGVGMPASVPFREMKVAERTPVQAMEGVKVDGTREKVKKAELVDALETNKPMAEPMAFSLPVKDRYENINWIQSPVALNPTKIDMEGEVEEARGVKYESVLKDTEVKPKASDAVKFGIGGEDIIDEMNAPLIPTTPTVEMKEIQIQTRRQPKMATTETQTQSRMNISKKLISELQAYGKDVEYKYFTDAEAMDFIKNEREKYGLSAEEFRYKYIDIPKKPRGKFEMEQYEKKIQETYEPTTISRRPKKPSNLGNIVD